MKRHIILILLACLTLVANAQALTDAQVVDIAKQRHGAGFSQTAIITELLEKGATRDQLLRVKQTYDDDASQQSPADERQVIDRSRINNGEAHYDTPYAAQNESADASIQARIFGHDIFRSKMLSFEPNTSIAVPSNYVLGAGDEIIVDIYGDSQRSDKLKVAPDGTVTLAYAGPVSISGKSVAQAQSTIASRLQQYYAGSRVKVSVGQTRAITINVMGEVATPGSYTLSAFASVFHALYMAGGINDIGTLREVKVCRRGKVAATVDVYDYILSGRLSGNIMLEDNDVILVDTYKNLVNIKGWVKRPMLYELKGGESLYTALEYAGGFKGGAYTESVSVERKHNTEAYVFTPSEDDFSQFLLIDGDVITVGNSDSHYTNMAQIKGAVYRPGSYEIGETTQTVRSLIEQAGGLKEDALRSRAVLLRLKPDRSREAIAIDIDGIMAGTSPDVAVQNEDELTVSSREKELNSRHLRIDGEVYNPGVYAYADNLTVEDLITIAGGVKESASLLNVEVSRRIVNPNANETSERRAEIFNVNLAPDLKVSAENTFTLQPYDEVFVRRSPEYSEQHSVWVKGEVVFQGRYVLENQNERLSDVINRTGGFTSKACIADARLKRHMNETELLRRSKLIQKAEASADSISIEKLDLSETYLVGIDLNEAIAHPGGSADLVLRDGDELIIPQLENTVKINGEVLYPNTVTHISGKRLSYYINQAGGYSKEAARRRAYIIYSNGQVSRAKQGIIKPGCEIVVPTKKQRENNGKTLATSLSITTAVATVGAVIVSALK